MERVGDAVIVGMTWSRGAPPRLVHKLRPMFDTR
jgi:hypothetical protein